MILSACLIVRNEERFLDRCLSSLRGIVDEICVLDTGSTDATVEIARAHGAVLGERPWDDDFSAARNACLDLARGEWILQIDADEELVGRDAAKVRRILSSSTPCHLVELELRGDGGRVERTWQPRLFRRDSGLRYRRALHETILEDLADRGLPSPEPCELLLVHHGYVGEVIASRDKIERNRRILRAVRDRGEADAYDLFKLASALDFGRDPTLLEERTSTWRSCLASGWAAPSSRRSEWPWWGRACRAAAMHLWFQGHLAECRSALERLLAERPSDRDAVEALAFSELRAGLAPRALGRLGKDAEGLRPRILCLLQMRDYQGASDALGGADPKRNGLRSRILSSAGLVSEAVKLLEGSFHSFLDDPEASLDAAWTLARLGETATARNLLSRAFPSSADPWLEREALVEALAHPPIPHPVRDIGDAARSILDGVLGIIPPSPLDLGFHRKAVLDGVADLLEDLLSRGDEATVRDFAARCRTWESVLPGLGTLVEGA